MLNGKMITAIAAAGLATMLLSGCGHYTAHAQPAWHQQAQAAVTQQYYADMGGQVHVLAASDGLGYQLFGPDEVRNQFAMLKHIDEAFARAESETQYMDDISPTNQAGPVIVNVEQPEVNE